MGCEKVVIDQGLRQLWLGIPAGPHVDLERVDQQGGDAQRITGKN